MDGDSKRDNVWGGWGSHPSLPQLLQLPSVPFQIPIATLSQALWPAPALPTHHTLPARPSPPSAPALEVEALSFTHNLPASLCTQPKSVSGGLSCPQLHQDLSVLL